MGWPSFPTLPGMEFPVKRTPSWSTIRQKAISGRETFQPQWPAPLYRYEVSFALLRQTQAYDEFQTLAGFYNEVMSQPGGLFQFSDPGDGQVQNQAIATGDGATTSFQLVRTLGAFTEPVLLPLDPPSVPASSLDWGNFHGAPGTEEDWEDFHTVPVAATQDWGLFSTLIVTVNGTPVSFTFATGNPATSGGAISIVPAPPSGAAIAWSGSYAWLCRLDEDSLEFSNFMYLLWELKKCAFTTDRP